MKIYLDDVRFIPDESRTEAKTPLDFFNTVVENLGKIEECSFDHDLGSLGLDGKEVSGRDCLEWFIKTHKLLSIPMPIISIHSANPEGVNTMVYCLQDEGCMILGKEYGWFRKVY